MTDKKKKLPKLPTARQFLENATTSTLIAEVVSDVRSEQANKPDQNAIREQQDWAAVANQVVGAEDVSPAV